MSSKISIFATLILLGWSNPANCLSIEPAEPPAKEEYQIKAEFLYNFLRFVSWPDEGGLVADDWHIGVIAEEEVIHTIRNSLLHKRVAGRHITVSAAQAKQDKSDYHVLFIADNCMPASVGLIRELKNDPVLVVGEVPEFASKFGIIGFVEHEDILRLEINPLRAQNAGLIISHKLASLGDLVDDQS